MIIKRNTESSLLSALWGKVLVSMRTCGKAPQHLGWGLSGRFLCGKNVWVGKWEGISKAKWAGGRLRRAQGCSGCLLLCEKSPEMAVASHSTSRSPPAVLWLAGLSWAEVCSGRTRCWLGLDWTSKVAAQVSGNWWWLWVRSSPGLVD